MKWLAPLSILFLLTVDLQAQLQKYSFETQKMGTSFRVVFYHHPSMPVQQLEKKVKSRIDQLNLIFSDYEPDSELNKLCETAGSGKRVYVSSELWDVLTTAHLVSTRSQGAFDVTIGPLSKLWRRAFRQDEFPERTEIEKARALVNYNWIKYYKTQREVVLTQPGMRLDLGGIAKGFTVDAISQILVTNGVSSYLIDGGGDIRVGLPPPEAAYWLIKTEKGITLNLKQKAIAVSGDTYKYLEWQGERYSHIIDPRTGLGIIDQETIYVLANDCMTADVLASTISVTGTNTPDKLLKKFSAELWNPATKSSMP